jgi:hypothetical protein
MTTSAVRPLRRPPESYYDGILDRDGCGVFRAVPVLQEPWLTAGRCGTPYDCPDPGVSFAPTNRLNAQAATAKERVQ